MTNRAAVLQCTVIDKAVLLGQQQGIIWTRAKLAWGGGRSAGRTTARLCWDGTKVQMAEGQLRRTMGHRPPLNFLGGNLYSPPVATCPCDPPLGGEGHNLPEPSYVLKLCLWGFHLKRIYHSQTQHLKSGSSLYQYQSIMWSKTYRWVVWVIQGGWLGVYYTQGEQ